MFFISEDGYRFTKPESEKEQLLSDWINSDIQTDQMLIEDANALLNGEYSLKTPLVGNRYKAYLERSCIFLTLSGIVDDDSKISESFDLAFVAGIICDWETFVDN